MKVICISLVDVEQPQVPTTRATNGLTSTSLSRAPGPTKNFVRGKSGHVPFWPGGFEDVIAGPLGSKGSISDSKAFRSVAPGLDRGLRLPGDPIEDADLVVIDEGVEVASGEDKVRGSDLFFPSRLKMVLIGRTCRLPVR